MITMIPKIFVGTMCAGEDEFAECCDMIDAQHDVNATHYIISDKPEWEAHNELWDAWNARKHQFDLFVKVDGDTVLQHDCVLRNIANTMLTDPRITGMQIPLTDYFTEKPILGLNCFTPKVIFTASKSKLYCDRVDTGHDIVLRNEAVAHLAPAGYHCKHPHALQAFHFGFHRMLKNQRHIMVDTYHAWRKHGDDARLWALLGAKVATEFHENIDFSYGSSAFNAIFVETKKDFELHKQNIDSYLTKLF